MGPSPTPSPPLSLSLSLSSRSPSNAGRDTQGHALASIGRVRRSFVRGACVHHPTMLAGQSGPRLVRDCTHTSPSHPLSCIGQFWSGTPVHSLSFPPDKK